MISNWDLREPILHGDLGLNESLSAELTVINTASLTSVTSHPWPRRVQGPSLSRLYAVIVQEFREGWTCPWCCRESSDVGSAAV